MIVFISHSSKDKHFVKRLAHDLDQENIDVWIDENSLRVGDNLSVILSKIKEATFFVIVMSISSQKSDWVRREVDLAKNIGHIKILPILIEDIEGGWVGDLARKAVADFRNQLEYRRSFYRLLSVIKGTPNPTYLTAKEAARLVKNKMNPSGVLFGISHQGIANLYTVIEAREWLFADSMNGASRLWIVEFFDIQEARVESYAVKDGKVHQYPNLFLLDSDPQPVPNSTVTYSCLVNEQSRYSEQQAAAIIKQIKDKMVRVDKRYTRFRPIPITPPYINSDEAISSVIKYLHEKDRVQEINHLFTLMKLEHDKRLGGFLVWNVSFFDLTLGESFLTIGVDAVTGEVKYPAMRSELLNANFFHMDIENKNYVINIKHQLRAIESRIWDIPDPRENSQKGLTAREALNMGCKLLESDLSQQWQFAFISNTGVLRNLLSPRFSKPEEGLMKRDGTAGQWVIEVYSGEPNPISEQGRNGFAYEFTQVLITRKEGAQFGSSMFTCKFPVPLSHSPLPEQLLNAYEKAHTLAVKHAIVGFNVMSVALDRFTEGPEWRFRFYDLQDIILRIRVSGDGARIIACDKYGR
ncbi:MAG: toll/interleukin-1 receptor domain-containing protein [Chitinophagaceae bacterium]